MLEETAKSAQRQRIYYVYTLARPSTDRRPNEVFYVGKGTKSRVFDHEEEAAAGVQSEKCDVIRDIWAQGGQVQKTILFQTAVERDALIYEWLLINVVFATSPLTNIQHNAGDLPRLVSQTKPPRASEPPRPVEPAVSGQPDEVITASDVARLIDRTVHTVVRLAQRGAIAAFKVGDLWRFHRFDVDAYIEAQERGRQRRTSQ